MHGTREITPNCAPLLQFKAGHHVYFHTNKHLPPNQIYDGGHHELHQLVRFIGRQPQKKGCLLPPSRGRPIKPVNVPHIFPLTVHDVAHLLATDSFPNVLHKQGGTPTLTKDTCHWLSFAATESVDSTTTSCLATTYTTCTSLTSAVRITVIDDYMEVGNRGELKELL